MQTLGERLEEARKRKGISIREAAEATKIRGDYLQKFEANSFDFDLPPLYIRGFLRTYAKFLEFDPQRHAAPHRLRLGAKHDARDEAALLFLELDDAGDERRAFLPDRID